MADPQEEAKAKQAISDDTLDHLAQQKKANADARVEYNNQQATLSDAAKKYGFQTGQQLMNHIGSDSVFAQKIVTDLLTNSDTAVKAVQLPDSSQENNLTGRLDHTVSPAVKVTETTTEPVNDGETATASEPVVPSTTENS